MMKKKILILIAAGGTAFLITSIILLLTGPKMRNQPSFHSFEAAMPLPPEDAVTFNQDAFDASTPELPDANSTNMQHGQVYYDYYCVFCHGTNGKGNGPVGQSYVPKPADLSSAKIKTYSLQQLYQSSFKGTGHEPVLERVVPLAHRGYILTYIMNNDFAADTLTVLR